jgi:hypothetical protein
MNRRLPVALWLAALAAAGGIAAGARYTADLSAFLPRTPSAAQQLLVDQLREGAVGRVMLMAIEGADSAARARLSRELAGHLRDDARFAYVGNGVAQASEREGRLLFEHRYLLSPAVSPERFSAAGLREAIGDTRPMRWSCSTQRRHSILICRCGAWRNAASLSMCRSVIGRRSITCARCLSRRAARVFTKSRRARPWARTRSRKSWSGQP